MKNYCLQFFVLVLFVSSTSPCLAKNKNDAKLAGEPVISDCASLRKAIEGTEKAIEGKTARLNQDNYRLSALKIRLDQLKLERMKLDNKALHLKAYLAMGHEISETEKAIKEATLQVKIDQAMIDADKERLKNYKNSLTSPHYKC